MAFFKVAVLVIGTFFRPILGISHRSFFKSRFSSTIQALSYSQSIAFFVFRLYAYLKVESRIEMPSCFW